MTIKGSKGMGSHKHGTSGYAGKSPKFRFQTQMELKKEELKKKPSKVLPYNSVADAFKGQK